MNMRSRTGSIPIQSLVLLLLLGSTIAQASIAVVQHRTNSGAANSNKQATSIASLGAGNLVVVGVCATGNATVNSITDNASTANTYQEVAGSKSSNGPSGCDIWYAVNSHSGATS